MEIGKTEFDSFEFFLGEWTQVAPRVRVLNDNSVAITFVKAGPNAAFKTRHISMRAHFIHDLIGTIEYVPSQENAADALTK
eukprot:619878-Prorocentrum_lima.AAC.1